MNHTGSQHKLTIIIIIVAIVGIGLFAMVAMNQSSASLLPEEKPRRSLFDIEGQIEDVKTEARDLINDKEFREDVKRELRDPENKEAIEEVKSIIKTIKE